ncbi:MAG: ATP-binding cassette domain-containing protein [Frankiales bacterium]|nr:ATP-binding cassette domain-containing protein [Frankiales bacterium]
MLEVSDLVVRYGPVQAVNGMRLSTGPGRITLVLGANGAGKTTTLRAICGLQRAERGSVTLDGRELLGMPPSRIVKLGVAMVPEGRRVFAPLTVLENLKLGGYTASKAEAAATLQEVFEQFPILADRRNGPAGLLSGGEQQMLAFGRALMSQASVILMDEPSMGLAPAVVDSVLVSARGIADSGKSVLMVEQNAEAGLEVADTVVVVSRGEVVYEGTVAEARKNPSLVRAFLGDAALVEG